MKQTLPFFLVLFFSQAVISQNLISNVNLIGWGSISAQEPNYGFYGEEFEITEEVNLTRIAAFIVHVRNRYDSLNLPIINFEIWTFDKEPIDRIYISSEIQIEAKDLDHWKKHMLEKPLSLPEGRYLIAVGQPQVQGFVAFGQMKKKAGFTGQMWMKSPIGDHFDGSKWFTAWELYEKIGAEISDAEVDEENFNDTGTMFILGLEE